MNLLKSFVLVSISSTLSRILGFIKDIIIARTFGASTMTDSFFTSFRLANLVRKIFAEGSFFQIFIPLLVSYKKDKKLSFIKDFLSNIVGIIILFFTILTILGIIFSPLLLNIFAPGFINTDFKFLLTIKLLRIIFPYILISTVASVIGSILNTWNEFIIPSISSILVNIVMIIFTIFSSSLCNPPILALGWSILVGSIFQLIFQLKYLNNINIIFIPKINLNNEGLILIINRIWPTLLSSLINNISSVFNTIFTSFLSSGSISWIYYADKLVEFPSGIIGITLNTILFPSLSKSISDNNKEEYSKSLDWGLRLCIILSIPITLMLIILAKPIIFSMFKYGNFSYFDSKMTYEALIAYSIGFIGIVLVKILTSCFYSYQDTWTPLKVSLFTFLTTQILNFILIFFLGHIGLSLSIGLTACLNSALLYYFLIKKKLFNPQPGWFNFIIKIIISSLFMSIFLILILKYINNWSVGNILFRLVKLFSIIFIGILVYIVSLLVMGIKIKDFYYYIK